MKFLGESLKSATNFALKELTGAKATGGVIGLDGEGNGQHSDLINCRYIYLVTDCFLQRCS